MPDPIALPGAPGSPHTRKMLAVLRDRRSPDRLIVGSHRTDFGPPRARVALLPTVHLPNAAGEIEAPVAA